MTRLLIALIASLASLSAVAEQKLEFGDYLVHYAALPTTDLAPAAARAYGVKRSSKRGLVVLNVQHRDRPQISIPARVSGQVRNLIGQVRADSFREVRADDAVYTIAEFSFSNLETLIFRIEITPQGSDQTGQLRFQQQFWVTPG